MPSNRLLCESREARGFTGPRWQRCRVSQWMRRFPQLELWSKILALPAWPGLPQGCSLTLPRVFLACAVSASSAWSCTPTAAAGQMCAPLLCTKSHNFFVSRMGTWAFFLTLRCCWKKVRHVCCVRGLEWCNSARVAREGRGAPCCAPRSWD